MKDYVSEHLQAHAGQTIKPRIQLADGTDISVQASSGHYCTPRCDGLANYSAVEVGFPDDIEFFHEYAERYDDEYSGVAGWVPLELVNEYIHSRGGPKDD